jgi:aryl-alcohol dehydrogenase-like predicted oxidoreductase
VQHTMRYKLLGRSGLRVSELCLGTMTFGEEWGWGSDRRESRRVFDTFVAAGGNFVDTANSYTGGTSERFVGEFVGTDRDRFVIATKYTHAERFGDPNAAGNHRKSLRQAVEGSLRRLGTDHIDLLWVHAWDALTPVDEVLRALDDLVRAGSVLYLGISDAPAWVASRADALAELRGWTRFVGVQAEYSLIERTVERDLLPMAQTLGLSLLAWAPLGAGLLTGKYAAANAAEFDAQSGGDEAAGATHGRIAASEMYRGILTDRNATIARTVAAVAREIGRSPAQVALAWLRARGPGVIPVVGARSAAQLVDNLGTLDLALPPQARARLDDASAITLGFPHDFLQWSAVRHMVYGGTYEAIAKTGERV